MSDTEAARGKCLCGGVRVTVGGMSLKVGACHCDMCRRWGGGPMLAVDCGSDVKFQGPEPVNTFDSSTWAERGFCSKCGTHLFYKLKPTGQFIIPVGLFGDAHDFVFDHQVFVDENPGYYSFTEETKNMTGQEVFDKYGSGEDGG